MTIARQRESAIAFQGIAVICHQLNLEVFHHNLGLINDS